MSTVTHMDTLPDILSGLAHGERYRYFRGRSGQRYIFTKMPAADLPDCRQAVMVLLPKGKSPEQQATPVWLGEIDTHGKRHGPRLNARTLAKSEIFVHLLAENAEKRGKILSDLACITATA